MIRLKDIRYDLFVDLTYRVYPGRGHHPQAGAGSRTRPRRRVTLESAQSGVWYVPPGDGYRLSYLTGRWAGETQLTRAGDPSRQVKVLESRRGNTSHQLNPWFAIDARAVQADEDHGRVWFGALGWSGNWKLVVEDTPPRSRCASPAAITTFDFA